MSQLRWRQEVLQEAHKEHKHWWWGKETIASCDFYVWTQVLQSDAHTDTDIYLFPADTHFSLCPVIGC